MYELQPLRIQAGWRVEFNNFTEYDMGIHGKDNTLDLSEDLLQLANVHSNLVIDLGWYPSFDENGRYILMFVKDYKWDRPLECVETQSKSEIIKCIEKWTCYGFWQKYK